jgi:hypothetical protein
VGNVVDDNFYTNIYILSHTQKTTPETMEIFDQILNNWSFNTNLVNDQSGLGYCSISTVNCVEDGDCKEGYKCTDNWKCVPQDPIRCYDDSECPENVYCDSKKAKTVRDTERLAEMKEIEYLAEQYNNIYGKYPKLEAGTYLAGKTTSVWPSWKGEFQKEMSEIISQHSVFDSLPEDPINRLSRCSDSSLPQYNQTTCWNERDKIFAGNVTENSISLPVYLGIHPYTSEEKIYKSYAYAYSYGSFNLCAPFENASVNVDNFQPGSCTVDSSNDIFIRRTGENNPPEILCEDIFLHPEDELSKYIQARDPEDDPLVDWSLSTAGTDWSSWSSPPSLRPSTSEGYREIHAESAGGEGVYELEVSVSDSHGNSDTATCRIEVGNFAPSISLPCNNRTRINNEYSCTFNAHDPDGDELSYTVSGLPPGLTNSSDQISGTPSSSGEYNINVTVSDPFGKTDSASYVLHVDTYCGDNVVQSLNNEGGSEECDNGSDNGRRCSPSYGNPCTYCDDSCRSITLSATGECGDGIVQSRHEQCDEGSNNGNVCTPEYEGSCTYCGDNCNEHVVQGPSCGDGVVNGNEECDGSIDPCPDGEYKCNNCQCEDGCGDGIIDRPFEECEVNVDVNEKRSVLQNEGVPGIYDMSDSEVEAIYDGACTGCHFQCTDWDKAGTGCYIEDTCEKGTYRCDAEAGEFKCHSMDPPLYDYCCENPNNPQKDGVSLHDLSYDVVYPSTSESSNSSFYCDDICRERGQVCIGVGLMDSDLNYCKSVKHHEPPYQTCADGVNGKDCTNDINVTGNDCTTLYRQTSNHCVNCANNQSYWFTVGGTACYCY